MLADKISSDSSIVWEMFHSRVGVLPSAMVVV